MGECFSLIMICLEDRKHDRKEAEKRKQKGNKKSEIQHKKHKYSLKEREEEKLTSRKQPLPQPKPPGKLSSKNTISVSSQATHTPEDQIKPISNSQNGTKVLVRSSHDQSTSTDPTFLHSLRTVPREQEPSCCNEFIPAGKAKSSSPPTNKLSSFTKPFRPTNFSQRPPKTMKAPNGLSMDPKFHSTFDYPPKRQLGCKCEFCSSMDAHPILSSFESILFPYRAPCGQWLDPSFHSGFEFPPRRQHGCRCQFCLSADQNWRSGFFYHMTQVSQPGGCCSCPSLQQGFDPSTNYNGHQSVFSFDGIPLRTPNDQNINRQFCYIDLQNNQEESDDL